MDSTKKFLMTITPSIIEAKKLLEQRFLVIRNDDSKSYIDIEDNSIISYATVEGVLMHKFKISQKDARTVLKHTYVNSYSGKQLYRPDYSGYYVMNIDDKWVLNTYRKPYVKANKKLSAQPFIDHLQLAIRDAVTVEFVLDFIAYRYKNPYISDSVGKPSHALYIFSQMQGQGQSLFTETLTAIFGDTAVKTAITADSLFKENEYEYWQRTWLVADKIKIGDDPRLFDNFKARISRVHDFIHTKEKVSFEATLPAQLIVTSNERPKFIKDNDRHFCIIEWDTGLRDAAKEAYFNKYCKWLLNDGFAAIAGLLEDRDLRNYNIKKPPPKTQATLANILKYESVDLERIVKRLAVSPEEIAFKATAFDNLNIPNKIKENLLGQAGLFRKRPYLRGKKLSIWIREGYKVKAENIINIKTGNVIKALKVDLDNSLSF